MNKNEDLQVTPKWNLRVIVVHTLVIIFGISAWVGVNGIFIQLPLLVNILPERWGLAAYVVIAIQIANIGPVIYSFLHKSSLKINELRFIYVMLGMSCFVMILLAFTYDKTSFIADKEFSTAFFALTFITSLTSCSSSVLFMPYLRNFKELYIVSYFIGEGLSGVLPSIIALIQGISENEICSNNTNINNESNITLPRFSSRYYFLFISACLFFSFLAFYFLENLSYIKEEKICTQSLNNNSSINDNIQKGCYCQEYKLTCNESANECEVLENHVCINHYQKTDIEKATNNSNTSKGNKLLLEELYLYILLSVICLLANGFLPGLQPYSCLAYGNRIYHLSATFSQIANPTACFLALWHLSHSKKTINYLSVVIFVASTYVTYLALSSSNPPFKKTEFGKILVILSWVLLVGLISYVKLIITSVFRRKSEKSLFYVGVVMQAGSACGAVLCFILINYTNLLQEHKDCSE